MATPKPLSIQDLSGAVRTAVAKAKLPPKSGPYLIIYPGVICGFILAAELREVHEAQQIAATVAKQVSEHTGVTVAPVVQEAGAQAKSEHTLIGLKPGHIIMGYAPKPEEFITFGF